MKPGETLSKDAVTAVIVKAGFSVAKFEGGPPPKRTAYVFRVTGIAPEISIPRSLAALQAFRVLTPPQ